MYSSILSAVVQGLEVTMVEVEMDVSNGLPSMQIVGSASTEVKEAGERVRTAIKNIGHQLPAKRIMGNLTPANIRKVGAAFDLPIAVTLLASHSVIDARKIEGFLVMGEVGLDGKVHSVDGVLPVIIQGKKRGIKKFIIPHGNVKEGAVVEGVSIFGVKNLEEIILHFSGKLLEPQELITYEELQEYHIDTQLDYEDIQGQEFVKRAIQIAVAGNHNILMLGPPGSGKSMIAQRIPSIAPKLTFEESVDISQVYSIMGMLENDNPFIYDRPFRSVHHTVTKTALVGGGNRVRPGEISLAHEGILFLDELPEFPKAVLEILRQPLEENRIKITRSSGSFDFPANIMLVAAMNPCPCGNYPDLNRCNCTESQISRYLGKISQPLLDRIDICMEVPKIEYKNLVRKGKSIDSKTMREEVSRAREIQRVRYKGMCIRCNENIPQNLIDTYCKLDQESAQMMESAYERLDLTARTYFKILKVARTIADMEGCSDIGIKHVQEAIGYRMVDKKYWGR